MQVALSFVLSALLTLWAAYWVIRLGVRHGVNDAIRKNRAWLRPEGQSGP